LLGGLGTDLDHGVISDSAAHPVELETAWLARILATPPPDAIAAANDGFAVAVMSALAASGLRTPEDIAVVGFDDSINVNSNDLGFARTHPGPPRVGGITVDSLSLTTVRAPFYELGRSAVRVAHALIRGEPVPDVTVVSTELVIRRSCGCPPSISLDAPLRFTDEHDVLTHLRHAVAGVPATLPADWPEQLSTAFVREVQRPSGDFLVLLNEFIQSSVRSGERVGSWSRVLSTLRQLRQRSVTGAEEAARAEDTWRKAHLLLAGTAERRSGYLQVLTEMRHQIARDVGRQLNTAPDVAGLTQTLAGELPKIDIPGCYLARYEPVAPSRSFAADSGPTRPRDSRTQSRLLLAYQAGTGVETGTGNETFASVQLVPGDQLRRSSPSSLVALPLYAKDQQLGFVLVELGPRIGWIYTTLQEQLSSALHRVLLIESDLAAQAAIERAHRRAERQRLAGELHDSVSQALFSMSLHTRALQLAAQDGADPQGRMTRGLAELQNLTQGALAELRALILQMRPESLHEEGLVVALRQHAAVLTSREGLDVAFRAPDDRLPLEEQAEEELFRVVQEAAHNSVKHARAQRIDLSIWISADPPGTLVVEVADDGTGFDPTLRRPGHLGLRIMRERVERIGGHLTIDSAPSRSTTIRAILPGVLADDGIHT
jgi:signal transduction histidine kinase